MKKTVRDLAGALRLLEERRVLTLTDAPGFVSLVSAVAGEKVHGSWWGHPKGKLIYSIATALGDHPDVLGSKLARARGVARATFLHRAAWPALFRVVTDPTWRRRKLRELPRAAVTAVRRVERGQQPRKLDKQVQAALEASALLCVSSEHTKSGAHETVWKTWEAVRSSEASMPASDFQASMPASDFDRAREELSAIGLDL